MTQPPLDVDRLALAIEDFNAVFIRLPEPARLSLSALSIVHTLSRRGPMRLTELVATEQIKQPALTAAVAKLEQDGLVSRRRDPRDGRAVLLEVTPAGAGIVHSRHRSRVEALSTLLADLPASDLRTLGELPGVLGRIVQAARADSEERNDRD